MRPGTLKHVKRRRWRNWQGWLKPERLVFVDETGAKTNMARLRGRSLKGQRPRASISRGHWKTTTFLAGPRTTGPTTPMVLDGAMNGGAFKAYAEPVLTPSLTPGGIVVMDNLSSHKVAGMREAIKGAGALLLYVAALFPGPQSHRTCVLKAQGLAPKSRRKVRRRPMARYGRTA